MLNWKIMGEEWTKEENTKTPGEILLRHKATHVQIKIQSKRLITNIVQLEEVCTHVMYNLTKWLLFIAWQNDRRRKKCWKIFFLVAKWIFARNLLAVWTSKVYFQNFLIRMNTLFSNAKAHLLREQSLVHSEMKYTVTPRRENQIFICLITGMQIAMSFRESKWMNYFKCSKHIEISAT